MKDIGEGRAQAGSGMAETGKPTEMVGAGAGAIGEKLDKADHLPCFSYSFK
jgi:hypothetical protein